MDVTYPIIFRRINATPSNKPQRVLQNVFLQSNVCLFVS